MKSGAPMNPFSVRFHEPGALPYRFREGECAEALWQRFIEAGRRGEIVGPHGTGKTTLLRTLEPVARAAGEAVRVVTLRDGQRWPRFGARTVPPAKPCEVGSRPHPERSTPLCGRDGRGPQTLFLDGAEQLAPVVWYALRAWARVTRSGLLVTTHRPLGLPTLYNASVNDDAARWVTRAVLAQSPEAPRLVSDESVPDLLAACHGNLREVLFRLYDAYEERWTART